MKIELMKDGKKLIFTPSELEQFLKDGHRALKELEWQAKMHESIELTFEDDMDDEIWHTFTVPFRWFYQQCKDYSCEELLDYPKNSGHEYMIETLYQNALQDKVATKLNSFGK